MDFIWRVFLESILRTFARWWDASTPLLNSRARHVFQTDSGEDSEQTAFLANTHSVYNRDKGIDHIRRDLSGAEYAKSQALKSKRVGYDRRVL